MKRIFWIWLIFLVSACQPQTPPNTIYLIDGEEIRTLSATSPIPAEILAENEIFLEAADRILLNGEVVDATAPLDCENCTLQLRRAVKITLITPYEEVEFETAAPTVGDAFAELGLQLYAADLVEPPVGTIATDQLRILYTPSRQLAIRVDEQILHIRSAAETVGTALIEAGIPLVGLDTSQPSMSEPLPEDGQIHIIRVIEKTEIEQREIPFEVEYTASNDVPIDQEEILTPGITGLIVSSTRIRYENGVEVSREIETERKVRDPSTQIIGYGTKYVIQSITVDGQNLEYWRALNVYATSYSPCNSGVEKCYPNTASGLPVKHGVIAVIRSWYNEMQGQAVYIPGYGYATIEDIGGGFPDKDWIDLGYTDANYQPWHHWVTIYFLK
ncbi:MAG: DUF348 domain-containing protein [Anaerolineae bacterium]|jgi:resuscitation-promoting factor RpfB|nr:DUF348 domain-containing protein [Anaerolineae bacterium]MBT7073465.1 DUF348 domain-containing protein [Anaerolineae bacterium]MBT7782889.1 DUF348 domain-containing protein [Anaerolineae bacterium]